MYRKFHYTFVVVLAFLSMATARGQGTPIGTLMPISPQNASQIELLAQINDDLDGVNQAYNIFALEISDSGRLWAILLTDRRVSRELSSIIQIWDLTTLTKIHTFESPELQPDQLWSLVFSPDEEHYAIAIPEIGVQIGNVFEWSVDLEVDVSDIQEFGIKFDPAGRLLAFSSSTELQIWDMDTLTLARTISGNFNSYQFTFNGNHIVTGERDGRILMWDTTHSPDDEPELIFEGYEDDSGFRIPLFGFEIVNPEENITFFYDNKFQMRSLNTGEVITDFNVYQVGQSNIIVEIDDMLYFADPNNAEPISPLPDSTRVLGINSDNTLAIGVSIPAEGDSTSSIPVTLIDVQSGTIVHELATLASVDIAKIIDARFSPMDDYIVMPNTDSPSGDRTLNVWGIRE